MRSFVNLGRSFEWDQTLGYTGPLASGNIPGYLRLDTRLGWRLGEFIGVQHYRPEPARSPGTRSSPIFDFIDHMQDQRSIFGKITWRF